MSEEMGCSVIFGGKIKAADLERIEEVIAGTLEYDRDPEEAAKQKKTAQASGSTNYGSAEEITSLLFELGIPFVHTSDAKYEYDGTVEAWDGKSDDVVRGTCCQDGVPNMTVDDLKKIKKDGGNLDTAIARLTALDWRKLPPVEIVHEEEAVQ